MRGAEAIQVKLLALVTLSLLALASVPAADAVFPPVCLEKTVGAAGSSVTVMVTCDPGVEFTLCDPLARPPVCVTSERIPLLP